MNAFILFIPIILVRYGLLGIINKAALRRAAFFAPVFNGEKAAKWIYQITNIAMILYLPFTTVKTGSNWFWAGLAVYLLGFLLYSCSTVNYAMPKTNGLNKNGLYRLSRNPMYVAMFICLTGCAMLAQSWILAVMLLAFQISSHWIILSEERWCIHVFGEEYICYMNTVRRYI